MEIQLNQKENHKTPQETQTFITKDLKEIKTVLFQLYRKQCFTDVQGQSESIEAHFKLLAKNLPTNQKRVLRAYLDFQLEDINDKASLLQNRPNRRQKCNYSFFPTPKHGKISTNQNQLLEAFGNWFKTNLSLNKGLAKKKGMFLKQVSDAQELLNSLFELVQTQKEQKESAQLQQTKYCQVTLILILITQLNLCIFLLYRRNYTSVRSLINKFTLTHQLLTKQNKSKQDIILKNVEIVEQLHKQQQKQLKQYLLSSRATSLRSLHKIRYHGSGQEKQSNKELKDKEGEDLINQKYMKVIDGVLEKNRVIGGDKQRVAGFLDDIKDKMERIQNSLLFETETDPEEDICHRLLSTTFDLRLFTNERLNNALNKYIPQKHSHPHSHPPNLSNLIFIQRNISQQSIYLSVVKNRNNLEISLKDYFNLCVFLKRSKSYKEAIIYFQVLVFTLKRKEYIAQYCIKEDWLDDAEKDSEMEEEERSVGEERLAVGVLAKFVKNQELFKIMLYAMVCLVELYEAQNAHYWSVQTLNYISAILSKQVIDPLQKIKATLNQSQNQRLNLSFKSVKTIRSECQSLTRQQKECNKLIKKYNAFLEEIKFKIIKSSFNSLTDEIMLKAKLKNDNGKNIKVSKVSTYCRSLRSDRSSLVKIQQQSVPFGNLTFNMQRLQQKENQLQSLISSPRQSFNPFNTSKMSQTCVQSPLRNNKFSISKISNVKFLKQKCKNLKKSIKGTPYHTTKNNNLEQTEKKCIMNSTNDMAKNSLTIKTNNLSKKQSDTQQIKLKSKQSTMKSKNEVKFSLTPGQEFVVPSCAQIRTYKSIADLNLKKNNTLTFLETSKTLNHSSKTARMGEHRHKILESMQDLQDHIKLCFLKLNSCFRNVNSSAISLDDGNNIQNYYDFTSQTDEVLNEFNQLLASLKTLRSHSEESFQREILIEAKMRLMELIKPKARYEKMIEMCVSLLNDIHLMKSSQKRIQIKRTVLSQLAQNYQLIKDTKNTISTYLQLARLGDTIGYLKIGEIYMLKKEYANSIRFHEKYATERNYDLSSKVKLAHAYSKVPQYYMKTVDMLTGILIAPGSTSKFKQEIYERRHDDHLIESAVILLSSLFFKNENLDKAIELCESYCKINIKNHRVLHILGGYYKYINNNKKSFMCYLNALQNNPTHHKSLIELTEFICEGAEYKLHAVSLLRRCFCMESRNFELLRTLIRFLSDNNVKGSKVFGSDNNDPQEKEKEQLSYNTLLKYASILNNSKNNGFSGCNFFQQASLVYEWALSLLDKSICIANLDQVEQIYKNLGQICLKRGDYAKSESYYKLYLLEIEKYVNRSNLDENLREEKINKTKIHIYHFLGKVKKHQQAYKKAIDYFDKSLELQKQYNQKLPNLGSYFHWFEVGHCYFMLENYEVAYRKFSQHKDHILYFINTTFDENFFNQETKAEFRVPSYIEVEQRKVASQKKTNFLRQVMINNTSNNNSNTNNNQNQSSQNLSSSDQYMSSHQMLFASFSPEKSPQSSPLSLQTEYVLKESYFQNEMYLAFCCDKMKRFIESKQIYKKVLSFFTEIDTTIQLRDKLRQTGKRLQPPRDKPQQSRQNYIKHITNNFHTLNDKYRHFKRVSLVNLANIYRIEGLENMYDQVMKQCNEEFPEVEEQGMRGCWGREVSIGRREVVWSGVGRMQDE